MIDGDLASDFDDDAFCLWIDRASESDSFCLSTDPSIATGSSFPATEICGDLAIESETGAYYVCPWIAISIAFYPLTWNETDSGLPLCL